MTEGGRGAVVVVGGTRAIGLEIVRHFAARGDEVILTGREQANVDAAVAAVGAGVRGLAFDLAEPASIAAALADVGPVRRLALVAIDRDSNTVRDYDIERAIRLVTLKLVGFTAVVTPSRTGSRPTRRSCCSAGWPRSGRIPARRPSAR